MPQGRVYVASPLGFSDPGIRYLTEVLHPALVVAGFEVLDPFADPDGTVARTLALPSGNERERALVQMNERLGAANAAAIESADAVLAVLDGSDVDSGTAAEIGFAAARGRPVIGLRMDSRRSGDNEAAPINLQVLHFIVASGGSLEGRLEAAVSSIENVLARQGSEPGLAASLRDSASTASSDRDGLIYHLTLRATWREAVNAGSYTTSTRDASLAEVGYIHASFPHQLAATAARFFGDLPRDELVVLEIDRAKLSAPLRLEPSTNGELFPHLYGPLNLDAVTAVLDPP